MKIFLYYIGKPRDEHANALAAEYFKRSLRFSKCEMREHRPGKDPEPWEKHPGLYRVALDPAGTLADSVRFAGLFERDLMFLIGAADGLPPSWRAHADQLLSLTPLTLPHELARAVLAEQIYRALARRAGHPYVK